MITNMIKIFSFILVVGMLFSAGYSGESVDPSNSKDQKLLILIWTRPKHPRLQSTYLLEGKELYYDSCFVTTDRRKLSQANAVIFTYNDFTIKDVPKRTPNQLWVLFSIEPVVDNFRRDYSEFGDKSIQFNLTASYSSKSDVTILNTPGGLVKRLNNDTKVRIPIFSEDDDVRQYRIALRNSCESDDWRENFISPATTMMGVNRQGQSEEFTCFEPRIRDSIDAVANTTYFFIMFQHNQYAREEIILDIWEVLSRDIIPVVYGAMNYTAFLPPGSFIDATNLTLKGLDAGLMAILTTDDEYSEYFQWRREYEMLDPKPFEPSVQLYRGVCSAIKKFNEFPVQKTKSVYDFQKEILFSQIVPSETL